MYSGQKGNRYGWPANFPPFFSRWSQRRACTSKCGRYRERTCRSEFIIFPFPHMEWLLLATPTCQSGARRPGHSKKADTLGLKGTVFRVLDPLYRILIHLHVFPLFICFRFQIWFQFHLEIFAYAKLFAVTLTQRSQKVYGIALVNRSDKNHV